MLPKILLSDGLPLVVSRTLANQTGLEQALVLQQVHYWLDPQRNPNFFQEKYWVHNTYNQWKNQFSFWSIKKIQRVFNTLETQGFLLSMTRYNNCYKTKFYTINYEKLGGKESFPSPLSQNGFIMTPNLSHGEDKDGRPSGHNGTHKCDTFEPEVEELCGFRGKGKMGSIVTPKGDDGEDKTGCTIIPNLSDHEDKTGLSYKLNTENTNREDPPPLTPPSQYLSASMQEEEGKSKKDKQETPPQQAVFQQMVDTWNAVVQCRLSDNQSWLTPRRVLNLAAFLQETPISDLASWKRYCTKIARSRFWRGENTSGLRITLDWALKPENAQKILEGAIYDKQAVEAPGAAKKFVEKPWAEYASLLRQHCEENDYSDRWFRACLDLAHRLGQATFENWFKGIVAEEAGETLTLETSSAFLRDYTRTHYEGELQKAIRTAFPPQTRIQIRVGGDPPLLSTALPDFCVNHRQKPDITSGDADVQVAAQTSLSQPLPDGV